MQRKRKKNSDGEKSGGIEWSHEKSGNGTMAAVWKEGGAEEAECLDALDQLKYRSITYQLLVSTQVLLNY